MAIIDGRRGAAYGPRSRGAEDIRLCPPGTGAAKTGAMTEVRSTTYDVDRLIAEWLADGVISPEQAARMRGAPVGVPAPALRSPAAGGLPLLAEGLAYLGGAVVVAGCSLIAGLYWGDLADGWRLALLVVAAAALLTGGLVVPQRLGSVGLRLRSVLWLVSTAAWTGAAAVLVLGVLDTTLDLSSEGQAVLISGLGAAYAAALWTAFRHGLQQVAMMAAVAFVAGSLVAWAGSPEWAGAGVWVVGLAWISLGVAGLLTPRELPVLAGTAMTVLGAMMTGSTDAGMVLTLVTVVGVVVAAVVTRDLALLALGALATLMNVPAAMARWFDGSVAAALALVVAGIVLVTIAIWIARRGQRPPTRQH